MKMTKTVPVAIATVFAITTAGIAFAQAPDMAKPHFGKDKVQTASYRHHDGGKGKTGMRGDRRGGRGFEQLIESFDVNDDGDVTQEEIISVRQEKLTEFDANKDGSLDLSEYEALWLDAMRDRMVDRFQSHDDDGDGLVTIDEFNEKFAELVERRDRNDDGVLNADDMKRPEGKGPGKGPHGRGDGPRR